MTGSIIIFSFLIFLFFMVYLGFGIFVLFSSPKEPINRVFFALTLVQSFWTLCFSINIAASDYATCLLWMRLSAIGWGSFYAIFLHFALILTKKTRILKKWWVYVLIYLPAAITIYVFSFSNNLAPIQYQLVLTQWGWTNIFQNTGWNIYFNLYYSIYSLTSLFLIWQWGRKATELKTKRQSKLIVNSYIIVFFLGTLTDIMGNAFFHITMPQLAPILMMIPIGAMFYSFRYYGFINRKPYEKRKDLITKISRQKIYRYLSIASIGGGILNIIVLYLYAENPDLGNVMILSFALFFFGLVIYLVQHLKLKEHTKDIICVGMIALLIPTITLHFIESGSVTVWAFPFILITAFIIFNRRILLVIIAASIIVTQCMVWILAPVVYVKLDGIDYCVRIGLFCIAILLIYYLNKLFIMRLNETAEKIKLQELITQISTVYVRTNQNNLEEDIAYLLKISCDFFSLDRTYICLFDHNKNTFSTLQEYCREGIESGKDHFQNIDIDYSHFRMEKILNNELCIISDMEQLPGFANEGMHDLGIDRIKSQIMTPILSKEKVIGFWGFDSETEIIDWQDDHINFIKIIANILGDTLTRLDSEKEITFMAHFDHITKLPNRNLFTNYVYFNIIKLEFTDKILGIIFLDLDSFKTVNDTVGHGMGDELLFMVGQKLKSVLKKADIVSRFSSDEFLIMIDNLTDEEEMIKITEDIMGLFYEPFILKGQEFFMTASAGVALYPTDGEEAETLIMNADIAKFKAKDKGRNQYLLCTAEIKKEINEKKQLINSLYRALENNELFLVYQPQVSLHTQKITGVESLLRWNHPELGMISPSVIIPLAEQTGLINPIGEWVLETACAQNKAWQDMGIPPIQMAVNISASQIKNPQFINQVEEILKKTGLNPEFLEVEITESIAILELNEIISKLKGLKALGISIAIDDFGTEYSSLGRLKMLPIHRLKMDKQFVDGIGHNHKDQAIANAIIQLGKSLDLSVVAEGVEYEDQIAFLKTSECDLIQGYFYYKPLVVTEIQKILISGCDVSHFKSTID